MGKSSKLDKVIVRVQHLTKQPTETPQTKVIIDVFPNMSNNTEQHRAAPGTAQKVVKQIQQFTEHKYCTLFGQVLDSFEHGLKQNIMMIENIGDHT